MLKRIAFVVGVIVSVVLILQYRQLDGSRKRYLINIVRQIPDMPGRYFA
jgi:hypothetical protein